MSDERPASHTRRDATCERRLEGSRSWSRARRLALVALLGTGALGCGAAVRPANPRIPGPTARFVERDAPFIIDWEPAQIASLDAAIRSPNIGAVVVGYRRGTIRLLPDCWISGIYSPSSVGMYTGTLQVRNSDSAHLTAGVRFEALQQLSTSARVGQGTLLTYRFVMVGRYDVSGSRASAGLLELRERAPDACRGATHFVRAAATGAFERLSDAYGTAGIQVNAPGVGAGVSGHSQQTMLAQGGDVGRCVMSGSGSDPACSAVLKIELAAFRPAVAALRLTAFTVSGQPSPNLRFRFRGKNGYLWETPSFAKAMSFANLPLPVAEISEDAPLVVEVVQQSNQGAPVVGAGEVTPSLLRQGVLNRGVFNVELRSQAGGAVMGTVQLTLSPG